MLLFPQWDQSIKNEKELHSAEVASLADWVYLLVQAYYLLILQVFSPFDHQIVCSPLAHAELFNAPLIPVVTL